MAVAQLRPLCRYLFGSPCQMLNDFFARGTPELPEAPGGGGNRLGQARQAARLAPVQIIDDYGRGVSHFIDIVGIYRYSLPALQLSIGRAVGNFN